LSRARTLVTCAAHHSPFPATVGMPRWFSLAATARSDRAPLACSSTMMGARSTARETARATRTFRLNSQAFVATVPRRQHWSYAASRGRCPGADGGRRVEVGGFAALRGIVGGAHEGMDGRGSSHSIHYVRPPRAEHGHAHIRGDAADDAVERPELESRRVHQHDSRQSLRF
jgi:hypothetical protein